MCIYFPFLASTPLIYFSSIRFEWNTVSHFWWWHQELKKSLRKLKIIIVWREMPASWTRNYLLHVHIFVDYFSLNTVKYFTNSNILAQEFTNVRSICGPSHPKLGLSLEREKRRNALILRGNKRNPKLHFQSLTAFWKWNAYTMVSWFHQQFSDIIEHSLHINSPCNWNRGMFCPWVAWIPSVSN